MKNALLFCMLLVTIMGFSQIPTDNLLVHYKFENSVDDASGNNRHGTIYGNPSYTLGVSGQALDFDGINDYVIIHNSDDLVLENFTISAWVRWDGDPSAEGSWAVISNWYGGASYEHYGLRMGTIQPQIPFNHAVIFYDDGTEWDWVYGYKEEISNVGWHSITGVVEAGVFGKIYLDGYLVGEDYTSIPFQINPTGDLYIARDGYGDGIATYQCERWNGAIDEVRIYNRVLTEGEIIDIFEDTPTAIKKIESQYSDISIFPNPSGGIFTINLNFEPLAVDIYDITGKKVLETTKNVFDLKAETKGIYIVKIKTKNQTYTKRIVLE